MPPEPFGRTAVSHLVTTSDVDMAAWMEAAGLLEPLVVGSGRRGITVRARRSSDGAAVAVKIGAPVRNTPARKRFLESLAAVRGLTADAHLVPVLDGGITADRRPWLLTPWMDGGSLADRLGSGGPLPVVAAIDAGRDAAQGLCALHRQGLVHANLTPANLVQDAHGNVRLDGMAVAGLEPDDIPAAPSHVPPQVLEGGSWTVAGDIWALGSCLYTLLMGQPPWAPQAGGGATEMILAMAAGPPPRVVRAEVPGWLAQLVSQCLSIDVAGRPGDAEAVLALLDRHGQNGAGSLSPLPTGRSQATLPPEATRPPDAAVGAVAAYSDEGRPLGSGYLLLVPLGSGSSGKVWRGRRRGDGAPVAVKVLRPELSDDPQVVARFVRERTALVGVHDPNVVSVLDLVVEGSTLAIVMELVDGPDLRRVLRQQGPLPAHDACALLAQVASGLAAVHRAGIIHRDLKPDNVLLEQPAGMVARARVTDFGIARTAAGTPLTRGDQLVGTADYLAPEVVAGRPLTPAADIYSLGMLAYELLSGRHPFRGEHPVAVLRAHLDTEPPRPPGLPEPLWQLVSQCLAKDPAVRPDARGCAVAFGRLAPTVHHLGAPPPDAHLGSARAPTCRSSRRGGPSTGGRRSRVDGLSERRAGRR